MATMTFHDFTQRFPPAQKTQVGLGYGQLVHDLRVFRAMLNREWPKLSVEKKMDFYRLASDFINYNPSLSVQIIEWLRTKWFFIVSDNATIAAAIEYADVFEALIQDILDWKEHENPAYQEFVGALLNQAKQPLVPAD
jgi:hypothetical protein